MVRFCLERFSVMLQKEARFIAKVWKRSTTGFLGLFGINTLAGSAHCLPQG